VIRHALRLCSGVERHAGLSGPGRGALKAAGCECIYSEKASGKSTDGRPEFRKLRKALLPGDAIVVTKLYRLARSSRDLHNIVGELKERGCGFVSLGDSWCDTTSDVGRLVLAIMGGIAEFERELIRKRCQAGIERAKRQGKKFGPKPVLDAGQRKRIAERFAAGDSMAYLAKEYDCSVPTVWRALNPFREAAAGASAA
jgi:DNA invertase Pin-like site-specific DNA recombinase